MSNKAKIIIGVSVLGILFLLIIGGLIGLTFMAANSNQNFGALSDLAETSEDLLINEGQKKEAFQTALVSQLEEAKQNLEQTDSEELTENPFNLFSTPETKVTSIENFEYVITNNIDYVIEGDSGSTEFTSQGNMSLADEIFRTNSSLDLNIDGQNIDLSGEMEIHNQELYLKLDEVNVPTEIQELLDLYGASEYYGMWLNTDLDTAESTTESLTNIDSDASPEETAKEIDKYIEIVNSDEFKDIIAFNEDRVINDVRTRCFGIEMNADQFIAFGNKIATVNDDDVLNADDEEEIRASIEIIKSQLCLGRGDGYLYYADGVIITKENEYDVPVINGEFTLEISNYNSDEFDTSKPDAEMTFEELFEDIASNFS